MEEEETNPCGRSPCGPNSQCREVNSVAVCSCLPTYVGSPPACRPECVSSSECSSDKACINQKCVNPCPDACGQNAECRVINHSPLCNCGPSYTGDPFTRCFPAPRKSILNHEQRESLKECDLRKNVVPFSSSSTDSGSPTRSLYPVALRTKFRM